MIPSGRVGLPLLCFCRVEPERQSHSYPVFEPREARCAGHVKSPICAVHSFSASMSCFLDYWFDFGARGFLVVVLRSFLLLAPLGYCSSLAHWARLWVLSLLFGFFEPRAARCAGLVKSPICAVHSFSAFMSWRERSLLLSRLEALH